MHLINRCHHRAHPGLTEAGRSFILRMKMDGSLLSPPTLGRSGSSVCLHPLLLLQRSEADSDVYGY